MADPHKYLDPLALAKVRSLELQARLIVEGYLSGMHKSPYHGFSVEFAQHREYVPGDDLKHLDWKVYSRTGRFYLKQYEEETNLALWLLVDASESMRYGSGPTGEGGKPAGQQIRLRLHGRRRPGVPDPAPAGRRRPGHLRSRRAPASSGPSSQLSHLKQIVNLLNKGAGTRTTRPWPPSSTTSPSASPAAASSSSSRDCFDELDDILAGLKHLRHKRHEVVVMHVLDRAEIDFPFQEATLFRGLEQLPELLTDPRSLRDGYLEQVQSFIAALQRGCLMQNIDYVQLHTDASLGLALSAYLAHRLARSR